MIQNFMGAEAGPWVLLLAMGGGASEEGREKGLANSSQCLGFYLLLSYILHLNKIAINFRVFAAILYRNVALF